jgi:xylulose-5-phosphate/fructose-6-phosphate phosphoketolase
MEVLSEHCCHGWLEGYTLTGRHGLFATYEAFAMIIDSMAMQHAKWIEHAKRISWRADVPSLNYLLTSTCWRNDHNGFSHQGPGFIDTIIHRKPVVARVYLPPDANCLLSVADHCFRSRNYLNLIVIDKQPQLQWLTMDEAKAHCAAGAGVWDLYSNHPEEPDIVLACAGDIPTQEVIAAAWMLRRLAPDLKVRVVNVVDLMRLCPSDRHPHGMSDADFVEIFTPATPVLFVFHGYPGVIHDLLHGRDAHERFHVRGYLEEGTTTTPFDMVVLNRISRLHLCLDVASYVPDVFCDSVTVNGHCLALLSEHHAYIREHFDDLPEIKDWVWSDRGD